MVSTYEDQDQVSTTLIKSIPNSQESHIFHRESYVIPLLGTQTHRPNHPYSACTPRSPLLAS